MAYPLRLYKKEKLCSPTAISELFSRSEANFSAVAYPIRAVWRHNPNRRSDAPVAFFISIPKKRLKKAVDRVKMRRRIREAYRLSKSQFPIPADSRIDLAFIYISDHLKPYPIIDAAIKKILYSIPINQDKSRNQDNH